MPRICKSREFSKAGALKHYAPHLILEPIHIEARLRFHIANKHLHATVTTSVRCNSPESEHDGLRTIRFDAVNFEKIERVSDSTQKGSSDSLCDTSISEWGYDGLQIFVTWKTPFGPLETRRVSVTYDVREPITGLTFSSPDSDYSSRPLFVFSDHEPERARYWLPCIDNPAIRTTFRVELEGPRALTGLSNGELEAEKEEEGIKTTTWSLAQRSPSYLLCVALGDFVRYDDEDLDGVPFSYFAVASEFSQDLLRITFSDTPEIQRWLKKKLGQTRFPFSKYYQLAVPGMGGAMENMSLTTWDDDYVLDHVSAAEDSIVEEVNVHEMAHSYFGDSLVMRHFEHAWLKESWATYLSGEWIKDNRGEDKFQYILWKWSAEYFSECSSYVRPIVTRTYDNSWSLFDSHLYPGGAMRLHMLRRLLGDHIFWTAVSDYVTTFQENLVDTDQFKKTLEKHSGFNLTAFFEEWIYGKGYMKLKGEFSYWAENGEAKIELEQTQMDEKIGINVFRYLPIEVEMTEENGGRTIGLGVFDENGKTSVSFAGLKKMPSLIRIDPNNKLLFSLEFNPGVDLLSNALRNAPDVLTRIRAVHQLVKIGSKAALLVISEEIEKEKCGGVRVQMAEALSRHRTLLTLPLLAKLLLSESDHLYRPDILDHCQFKDKIIGSALREFLKKKDLGYLARSRALEGLGRQEDVATDRQHLLEATHDKSYRLIVAKGAYKGLGYLRDDETFEFLVKLLEKPENQPERLLSTLIQALASVAAWQPAHLQKKVVSILRQFLRFPRVFARDAAIYGLVSLRAVEAIEDFEGLRVLIPPQDQSWLDSQIQYLVKSTSESVSKLFTEYDNLCDRLKKFENANNSCLLDTSTHNK